MRQKTDFDYAGDLSVNNKSDGQNLFFKDKW